MKKIVARMSRMSRPAWYIFKRSMQMALLMLCCGLLLTLDGPGSLRRLANAFYETTEAVVLLGSLLSVLAEDQQSRR